jgi:DNA-directed RNA polymerase specialized sigma24 family protein
MTVSTTLWLVSYLILWAVVLFLGFLLGLLAAEEETVAAVVKLRYFAGLSIEQTAKALGISVRTANRHWAYARAWLYQQLSQ